MARLRATFARARSGLRPSSPLVTSRSGLRPSSPLHPIDWLIALPFVVLIGVLLVGPLISLGLDSFHAPAGGATIRNWTDALTLPLNRRAIIGSIALGALVATLSTLVGSPLAWLISRLPVGHRSLGVATLSVAANIPATSLAFGFTAAFGGAGMVTLVLQSLFPDLAPVNLYSPTGLVLVYLYFHVPLFVLLTLPGMGAVTPELWEAAATSGAGPIRFWLRIGIPILAPFLAGGWILMFVWAVGAYAVPLALVGTNGKVDLMTLRIGDLIQTGGTTNRFERAACLSLLLVFISVMALGAYHRLVGRAFTDAGG